MKIPYSKVFASGNEKKYVNDVLESGWLTTSKKTEQFEKMIADYTGAKYALAVNSCTSALHLALDSLGVQSGDKVLIPSLTFTATAEVVRYMGAIPVLMDIDFDTRLTSPDIIESAIKNNNDVKVMILVHFAGQTLDMRNTLSICKENNIKIVEDCAHALPSRDGNLTVGNIGDISCFSFYANKTITTGEGGMVLTNDDKIANRIKIMRLHGIDRDVWHRFNDTDYSSWEYDVVEAGFKYNMPDINAAVGIAQFERMEEMHSRRCQIAQYYFDNLSNINGVSLPKLRVGHDEHSWHLYTICVERRNEFIKKMQAKGIGTSVHYKPIHNLTYYKDNFGFSPDDYPNTEKYWQQCVSLPIYDGLQDSELKYICNTIRDICE